MIKLTNINKIYNQNKSNQFTALKNINLKITKNQIVIINGVSGSGKTTLLSIMATFTKPTSGKLEIIEEQVTKYPDIYLSQFRAKNIGFVFQSFNLFENLSVLENILPSLLVSSSIKQNEQKKKIEQTLKLLDIYDKKDQIVSTLSGGEKQRCAIVRAIINDPNILFFDEPTANLDQKNSQKFLQIVKKLKSMDKTIIISTHDTIFDKLDCIDKTITLSKGDIVEQ